ncbi:hypothetical protein CPB84DRAFT_1760323 [Gymnopilus junonius]|uniref:NAD-dependent epimerase/dehydratase domain-containing protein n=1 Tax=Gymnopilus junonius TaxID=109634 RepID=A0A9P5TVB7_GYMJU|nr:hypothetical protein CPB84DRAFT_1760323 [Gymnopilus junonius]
MSARKVVICGAGFLGRHIARAIVASPQLNGKPPLVVQISSRNPLRIWNALHSDSDVSKDRLLPAVPVDITEPHTIKKAFTGASIVVSLVGIMHGSPADFERVQLRGAENIALAARDAGARLIHFSALGADPGSHIPYTRTKGLAELSVLAVQPGANIIRPSLVFGPEDDFFNRFAKLSKFLPFLPVFGGGESLFQPIYVDDIARLTTKLCEEKVGKELGGKIIEAGGPQIYTYRDLMRLILETTGRGRPILSFPFAIGKLQGAILEKLPTNLLTVTRAQIEQLQLDNIVQSRLPKNHVSVEEVFLAYNLPPLRTLEDILPTYLHTGGK